MAVPPSNPNRNINPQTLTPAQRRTLINTLQSTAPNNAPNGPMAPSQRPAATTMPTPVVFQQPPIQQRSITIDASTRIMGHCNNVALAWLTSTEQQVAMIQESFVRSVLQPHEEDKENAVANKTNMNINLIVHAGVNIIGSKNVVAFNGNGNNKRDACNKTDDDTTKVEDVPTPPPSPQALAAERKRRAVSEPALSHHHHHHHQTTLSKKKVKVEE